MILSGQMSARPSNRKLVRLLGGLGISIAVALAVIFQATDRIGEGGILGHILGSFFALLAIGGLSIGATTFGQPRFNARIRDRDVDLFRLVTHRVVPAAALIVIAGFSIWSFRDLALNTDHAPHCFSAYQFWTEMLGKGRIRGWSHFWSFGYPAGELYPFGAEVWVAAFYALTFGLLGWIWTYAVAMTAMLMFATFAMFVFARRFFGITAGVVAAALWIGDPGAWYQGGWFWHIGLGVWPVSLGMAMTLLALVKLADVLSPEREARRRWDCTWAALWMAASLITHLLPLVVYPIALPCLWLNERARQGRLPGWMTARFVASVAIGFGLASFSLIPMMARSNLTMDLGVAGYSLEDLAHRIVELRAFEGVWQLIHVLALVGGIVAMRNRARAGLFFVLCGAIFVLLSSNIVVSVFHLERLSKGFLKIENQRMLLVAKLFWYPLAGHAVALIARRPRISSDSVPRSPLPIVGFLVLVSAIGAPLLRPVATHIYNTQVNKPLQHQGEDPIWRDLQSFFAWSRAAKQSTTDFYRIAYKTHPHHHIFTISPIFNQTPIYKVGYTSTQIFRSFPMSTEPELLEALSVKYMVADSDVNDPSLVLERTFGQLRVYRFTRYHPHHPFTLIGGGQGELVRFEPELIQIRLQGTTPGTKLKLHVNAFPRWEATLNGRHVPISPATAYGMEYPFLMEVPASDGDLVFRYQRRAIDWAGLVVTWLALVGLALVVIDRNGWLAWRQSWYPSLLAVARPARAVAPGAAGGIALLGAAFVAWRLTTPPQLSPGSVFDLPAAASTLSLGGRSCQVRGPSDWRCGDNHVTATIVSGGFGTHYCMNAPAVGTLVVNVDARLGRFLEGRYDGGAAQGTIRVFADDQLIGQTATRRDEELTPVGLIFIQIDTRPRAGQKARLRFELTGAPLRCFDFSTVP
jgi:hypothetical protein